MASQRYIDFALSQYSFFTPPTDYAFYVLEKQKKLGNELYIASSSQTEVVESKKKRLEIHFPDIFEYFHTANHYSLLAGPVRSKADICREISADVMIDDNPKHLLECVSFVKTPILFGNYPWNEGKYPGLIPAADWLEVEQVINSRA